MKKLSFLFVAFALVAFSACKSTPAAPETQEAPAVEQTAPAATDSTAAQPAAQTPAPAEQPAK